MRKEYWMSARQLELQRINQANKQAKIERQIRDMKDLAREPYMGSGHD